ncbi:MAG: DUF6155 family protein [Saprospiraceae bacterium]
MGLSDLKKELQKLDKDKLIELLAELYKKNKSVKEFFDSHVNPNELELFKKYRDKVFEAFYPKRGINYKLKDGKQAISDFKKLGAPPDLVADLMLFYVETGVKYTKDFGDLEEGFYSSMETTYLAALTNMNKENVLDRFVGRARKVVSETSGMGWGFHDCLAEVYCNFYGATDDIEEDVEQQKKRIIIKRGRPIRNRT